jgi:hypothetical protein
VCYPPPRGRLPTCYSPVRHCTHRPKPTFSFDLHVLGTPPAFVLSQDQTLQFNWFQSGKTALHFNKNKEKTIVRHKLPSPLFSSQRPKRKPHQASCFHNFPIIVIYDSFVKRIITLFNFFLCRRPLPAISIPIPTTCRTNNDNQPFPCLSFGTFLRISLYGGDVKENMRLSYDVLIRRPLEHSLNTLLYRSLIGLDSSREPPVSLWTTIYKIPSSTGTRDMNPRSRNNPTADESTQPLGVYTDEQRPDVLLIQMFHYYPTPDFIPLR